MEYVELSRRRAWRNDSHFEPCGQMGADACSSVFSAPPRPLRDRFSGLCAPYAAPDFRAAATHRPLNQSRRGAEHAESAEALHPILPDFLVTLAQPIVERQNPDTFAIFRLASSRKSQRRTQHS